jgi:pantoate--beta-alanine ligase
MQKTRLDPLTPLLDRGADDVSDVRREMKALIKSEPLAEIEYIEVVEPRTLQGIEKIEKPVVICLAVKIGETRLIDNLVVE